MLKNKIQSIICFALAIIIILSFNACSSQKNSSEYVVAKAVSTFSELNDTICWTTNDDLFLENSNELKNSLDYHLDKDPDYGPYYSKPLLVDNYLYYIGGVYNYNKHEIYIARIDYTIDEPKFEKLTEIYSDIDSYTVCGNYLYYIALKESEAILYRMNLLTKNNSIVMDNSIRDVFATNGDKIIMGNLIFDIKNQKEQLISYDKELFTLGVFNNKYYCYCDNDGENYKLLQINLDDNSIVELCEISYGMDVPQMFDDKILFSDLFDDCVNVGYYYYDIPTNSIVTVIDSDNSTSRYTDTSYEPIHYDYIMHNGMYYFHYSNVVARMNIDTKEEELFKVVTRQTADGWYTNQYEWISYSDYCTKN